MSSENAKSEAEIREAPTESLSELAACPARYEIRRLLGQGGMGMVFHAYDKEMGRDVAIKILLYQGAGEEHSQQRFLREAQALASLSHPNIVTLYSSGINSRGNPYHVIEYLQGETVSDLLARKTLNPSEYFELFSQVLEGLEHAHKSQIVHRDLKPSNIMHCHDADGNSVYKIIDFGLARLNIDSTQAGNTITRSEAILGSPTYMSPEQCRGERGDKLSDIYSLACIMYEALSGKALFQAVTSLEIMYKHISEPAPRLAASCKNQKSKQLADLLLKCLSKNPSERPQNVEELSSEFAVIFSGDKDKIDLFARRNETLFLNSNISKYAILAICSFVLLAFVLVKLNDEHKSKAGSIAIPKPEEKDLQDLQDQRVLMQRRWRASPTSANGRKLLIRDLFTLGRLQLKSPLKEDKSEAENTYSRILEYCKSMPGDWRESQIAALALRGKAEGLEGKFDDAKKDFADAFALAKTLPPGHEITIDLHMERGLINILSQDFASALRDYESARAQYDRNQQEASGMDVFDKLKRVSQELDKDGADRSQMTLALAVALSKMRANSDGDAELMVKLANQLAMRMKKSSVRSDDEVRIASQISADLLPRIKTNPELVKETKKILKYCAKPSRDQFHHQIINNGAPSLQPAN